jgi:hypothetical protein
MATAAFILTTYAFYIFTFALLTSLQVNNEMYYSFHRVILSVTLMIFLYATLYLTSQLYLNWRPKYD